MADVRNAVKNEINDKGQFVRQRTRFTTPFGNGEGELPVEAGRYRLLWTPVCPFAHRQKIAFALLGLNDVISTGKASPIRAANGSWEFSLDPDGVDPVLGIRYLKDIYLETDPEYTGRCTVPAIADIKTHKIVNNDYFRLTNYWEVEWKAFHKEGAPDLYPEELREDIDALNEVIFNDINNGVYRAVFAKTKEAYEEAYNAVFNRLDWLEERLSKQRYLFGDRITDSDIRLYVSLARFDVAYYPIFRVNRNKLVDFPNLWNYAKDLYQTPGFGNTTDFDGIKKGYASFLRNDDPRDLSDRSIDLSIWNEPHDRARFDQ